MPDPANAFLYASGPEAVMAGPSAIGAISEAQNEMIKALNAAFEAATKRAGSWLRSDFVNQTGSVSDCAAGAAILAEALVFPHGVAESAHALNPAFEHVIMQTRLPVVIASSRGQASGPCMIAWDGSPQAARSVRLHLPLIRAYEHIVIVQHPGKVRASSNTLSSVAPEALADWLHDEQLATTTALIDGKVSDGLLAAAKEHGAGLLVMGAYGHSRMGEMLFGGTSRRLLSEPDAPALALCH